MSSLEMERLVVDLAEQVRGHYWGKYRGTVDRLIEDDPPGQIVAKVPSVYGDTVTSPPALPALPFAGDAHGLVMLPEPGDGVWIEFEGGNPSYPIWTGFWFATGELPSSTGPQKRALVTKKDLELVFDDDAEEITITHPGGAKIKLDSNSLTLQFGTTVTIVLDNTGINLNNGAFKVTTP
jgi:Type VI secretion system/phage-baseplate injector OB domain